MPAIACPDPAAPAAWTDTFPGILAAIGLAALLSGYAWVLTAWPAEAIPWSIFTVLLLGAGATSVAPRWWPRG